MAKGKDEGPNPHSVTNRDVFHRLSFLYQASAYLNGLETTRPAPHIAKKGGRRRTASLLDLGSSYIRNMRVIGNKTVSRMDPNIKRTICKLCDTVLVPGTTVSVRIKGAPSTKHKVAYTCLKCRTSRAVPAPPVASACDPASSSRQSLAPTASNSLQDTPEGLGTPTLAPSGPQTPPSRKIRTSAARPLPLFARQNAGHVVFRGNEVLRDPQG